MQLWVLLFRAWSWQAATAGGAESQPAEISIAPATAKGGREIIRRWKDKWPNCVLARLQQTRQTLLREIIMIQILQIMRICKLELLCGTISPIKMVLSCHFSHKALLLVGMGVGWYQFSLQWFHFALLETTQGAWCSPPSKPAALWILQYNSPPKECVPRCTY